MTQMMHTNWLDPVVTVIELSGTEDIDLTLILKMQPLMGLRSSVKGSSK